jgi:hypothetical protein
MTQTLYAHMNNKRKMKKKIHAVFEKASRIDERMFYEHRDKL